MPSLTSRGSIALLLWTAACAADGAATPDAAPTPRGLDRCAEPGVALAALWNVDNLHDEIVAMAGARDGTIVVATSDGALKQWDVGTSASDAPLPAGQPSYGTPLSDRNGAVVRALAVEAAGDAVLGGDAGGGLRRWALPDATMIGSVPIQAGPLTAVAAAGPGTAIIADETFGGAMRVVELESGRTSAPLATVLWGVTTLATSGDRLYTAGHDYGQAAIERRDLAAPAVATSAWDTLALDGWVRSLALDAAGTWLAAGGDGFVVVLATGDLAAGPTAQLAIPDGAAARVLLTPSGAHVVVATPAGVSLWTRDLATEVARVTLAGVVAIALDPSSERLLVADQGGRLRAYGCR